MKPTETAKSLGCESLAQVSKVSKQSVQTLINWHKNKPELFGLICKGVANDNNTKK